MMNRSLSSQVPPSGKIRRYFTLKLSRKERTKDLGAGCRLRYDAHSMASTGISRYLKETRQPVYSAALVLPYFLVYHLGSMILQTTFINGADALIIRILSAFSVHSIFASALVLLFTFVIWQLKTRADWSLDANTLMLLFLESALYAAILFGLIGWLQVPLGLAAVHPEDRGGMEKLVLFCGAGIYEELFFRGFLLGSLLFLLPRLMRRKRLAAVFATVAAALLFAMFHYVGPNGDPFSMGSFMQRTLGGLYFSTLFATRGFGVTASCHALYDVFVGGLLR